MTLRVALGIRVGLTGVTTVRRVFQEEESALAPDVFARRKPSASTWLTVEQLETDAASSNSIVSVTDGGGNRVGSDLEVAISGGARWGVLTAGSDRAENRGTLAATWNRQNRKGPWKIKNTLYLLLKPR